MTTMSLWSLDRRRRSQFCRDMDEWLWGIPWRAGPGVDVHVQPHAVTESRSWPVLFRSQGDICHLVLLLHCCCCCFCADSCDLMATFYVSPVCLPLGMHGIRKFPTILYHLKNTGILRYFVTSSVVANCCKKQPCESSAVLLPILFPITVC